MIAAFFFSSRRRHTRYWRDWSSDVCSSDLAALQCISAPPHPATTAGILSCSSAEHDVNVADSSDSCARLPIDAQVRSEEHTSELQSRQYLVCRLLLEKKKKKQTHT